MIGNRISAFALAAAFVILGFAPPAMAAPYDGSWTMIVMTTNGHCGTIKVGLAISAGKISSTSGKFVMRPIKVAGIVSGSKNSATSAFGQQSNPGAMFFESMLRARLLS